MTPADFTATYRPTANQVSSGTGIDPIALLAQWWNETAGGTSWAGAPFNLGNIQNNGVVIQYASLDAFAQACIAVFHLPAYAAVLAATNAVDQLAAIVASPWAAGHYNGSLMAEYTLLEDFELTPAEDQTLTAAYQAARYGIQTNPDGSQTPTPFALGIQHRFDTLDAAIKALQQSITPEPPEPPEPTKVTLNIPAQTISGTLG